LGSNECERINERIIDDGCSSRIHSRLAYLHKNLGSPFIDSLCSFLPLPTGSCEEAFVQNQLGDFDGCTRAESEVSVLIPADMDPLLVERVAISDIQTFIAEFNADQAGIQILFEYPIAVSAVIRVSLQGVEGTADTLEKEVMEETFRLLFAPILQANDPIFTLDLLQVLIQQASDGVRRFLRASLRMLQGADVVPYNNVDLYIRSVCEGTDCTDVVFKQIMVSEFQGITEALEIALRAAGRDAGLAYFETLTAVQVGSSDLGNVLPPGFASTFENTETDDDKIPAWIWIILAVDFVILALALAWVIMSRRQKEGEPEREENDEREKLEMEENDDVHQEDELEMKEYDETERLEMEEYDDVHLEDE
jgi:hypothetical protein